MANIEIFGTLVRNDDNTNRDKIVQGYQVEGGYFVCESLPTTGTWATGQLCYCQADNKFYQYNGTNWVEKEFGTKVEASTTNGKIKLAGVDTTVYTHATHASKGSGLYKITVDSEGHVSAATAVQTADITGLGIQAEIDADNKLAANLISGLAAVATSGAYGDLSGTPGEATKNDAGLMSATDKANLDTLTNLLQQDDEVNTTIDTIKEVLKAFENAPEGTNIANALAGKSDTGHTHTVSHTPAGTISQPTFTGTEAGHTHSFSGSASHNHTFTGTTAEHNHTFTGTGTLIKAAFAGTEQTASVSYTPAGTVSTPTITVTPTTATVNSITAVGTLPELTYTEGKASQITSWSAGSAPSLTSEAVEASKITGWSAGTLPSLKFTQGSLPSATLSEGSGAASLTGSVSNNGPNRTVTLTFSHSHTAPSLTFDAGSLPDATFSAGTAPALTYNKVEADNIINWSAGSASSLTYSEVDADNITKWYAGNLPTKGSNTTVVTGIQSATSSQPSFTGTAATISHKHTPSGTITITTGAPGSGEAANYTPAGTISNTSLTPAGTISSKSVSISGTTVETKITPAGTVSQPTFSGTAATLTTSAASDSANA